MIVLLTAFLVVQISAETSNPDCSTASCVLCSTDSTTCSGCKTNYILKDGVCIHKSALNCAQVYEDTCQQCEIGYKLDQTTKGCVEGTDGCLSYNTNGRCVTCYFNYLLVNEVCTQCEEVAHCTTYDGNCKCTECALNYYPTAQNTCETSDIYCTAYDSPDHPYQCKSCVTGFYLNTSTYTCEQGATPYCNIYTETASEAATCVECLPSYILMDDNTCTSATEIYGEHCLFSSSKVECTDCDDGFYSAEKTCKSCFEHCAVCSSEVCQTCESAYAYDTETKKCEDGTCLKSPNEAYKCNELAESEEACSASGQNCVFETVNDNTFMCLYKGSNCTSWDVAGDCEQCRSSEYKRDSTNTKICVPRTENCKTYGVGLSGLTKCVECLAGYFMNDDFTCSKCDAVCSDRCEYQSNYCAEYTCTDFVCTKCTETVGKCEKCLYNKVTEKNTCGPIVCTEPLTDGNCGACAKYSEETKIVHQYTDPTQVPVTIEYYLPGLDLNCFTDNTQSSSELSESSEEDLTWLWITLGVVGGVLLIAVIILVVVVVIITIKKKKGSEYSKIEQ
ncbi:hypothetical protein EIN_401370 [Entamoeba invadens IP1]|uniref:Furin repeat-containing protein n=1 Tax=Entamoeba invadens IP1 TaxID=370355 RepID=A0A0A1UD75_ENTIV|nr:hypothetical protein EIN_401370 [Entamoeba invadens IP1]ELP94374.1 hypothetical protein EIN_401370 [Entamoeba invadens IP1]|eukprot:XP_004261145.1 hypothetical protein EIN_401370 [Entamoeba invadens IP1]